MKIAYCNLLYNKFGANYILVLSRINGWFIEQEITTTIADFTIFADMSEEQYIMFKLKFL
jgi:hypothetical protein